MQEFVRFLFPGALPWSHSGLQDPLDPRFRL